MKFSYVWSTDLLRHVISHEAKSIASGEPTNSFLTSIYFSMKFLFRGMVEKLLTVTLANLNLHTLMVTISRTDLHMVKEFIPNILDAVIPVPDRTIDLSNQNDVQTCSLIKTRLYPPNFPYYDSIEGIINSLYLKLHQRKNHDDLVYNLGQLITSSSVCKIIEQIEKSELLKKMFTKDIICRTFGLQSVYSGIPEIFEPLMNGSLTCLEMYCLGKTNPEIWNCFALFGKSLEDSMKFSKFDRKKVLETMAQSLQNRITHESILNTLTTILVSNLWDFLIYVVTDISSTPSHLKDWTSTVSVASVQDTFFMTMVSDQSFHQKIEKIMTVYYFVMSHEDQTFEKILEMLRKLSAAKLLDLLAPKLSLFVTLTQENQNVEVEKKIEILEDILSFGLRSNPSETKTAHEIPRFRQENIREFLMFMVGDFSTVHPNAKGYIEKLSMSWRTANLATLLDKKTKRFVNVIV